MNRLKSQCITGAPSAKASMFSRKSQFLEVLLTTKIAASCNSIYHTRTRTPSPNPVSWTFPQLTWVKIVWDLPPSFNLTDRGDPFPWRSMACTRGLCLSRPLFLWRTSLTYLIPTSRGIRLRWIISKSLRIPRVDLYSIKATRTFLIKIQAFIILAW